MYSYIKGTITETKATHITIECGNIGYLVKVANPYQYEIGSFVTVFLHQVIKEDAHDLYGFKSNDEKSMFLSLISVKGLGPKGALAIIASSSISEIVGALNNNNAKYFTNFPGIGLKLSQQIILDLKGKVNFEEESNTTNEKLENVMLALKSLGYSNQEIKTVTKNLKIDDLELKDAVKVALKALKKS